jgi:hypothetical protein
MEIKSILNEKKIRNELLKKYFLKIYKDVFEKIIYSVKENYKKVGLNTEKEYLEVKLFAHNNKIIYSAYYIIITGGNLCRTDIGGSDISLVEFLKILR